MRISAIVLNTFREAIREKALYLVVAFGILLIISGRLVTPLALGEEAKIMTDLGLSALSLFSLLIVVLVGTSLLRKEMERHTAYSVLSKPVRREEFILGKYLGLLLTVTLAIFLMSLILILTLRMTTGKWEPVMLLGAFFAFLEAVVLTGAAVFFSTFAGSVTSSLFILSIYVLGETSGSLKYWVDRGGSQLGKGAVSLAYYMLPNLTALNVRGELVHGVPVTAERIIFCFSYSLLYAFATLAIAVLVFRRRDLA
ncbi:MAG: ABC transporter permease [Candidatus Eisenbacteria bacterium]|nr:ABC transporter permease [Candidatus Eisenbacteria bacterium]